MKYLEMELRDYFARLDRAEQLALVRMAQTMASGKEGMVRPTMPVGFSPRSLRSGR